MNTGTLQMGRDSSSVDSVHKHRDLGKHTTHYEGFSYIYSPTSYAVPAAETVGKRTSTKLLSGDAQYHAV